MMRTTYGVEFLMGLSKVELVLFFMLSCFADGNGLVSLYKDRKVRLCGKLGISSRSLRRSIVGLVDGGLLKQKGDELMINLGFLLLFLVLLVGLVILAALVLVLLAMLWTR